MTHASRTRSLVDLFCLLFITATIALMVGRELNYSWTRGNQLSEVADPYGEADVLHSAEGYTNLGLTSHWGLPDVSYGTNFDRGGGKYDPNLCAQPVNCIYLHNPPGNPLTVGVLMKLFGINKLFIYRAFGILIGALALAYLARVTVRTQGAKRAAFVYLCIYMMPMSWNMMHSICYHGYLLAYFFIELGILLSVFSKTGPLTRGEIAGLIAVVTASSCFAYEWIFVMTLLAIPAWLAVGEWRDSSQRRKVLVSTVIMCAAFGTIQVLHILQVAGYLGGLRAALTDLAARGSMRTGYADVKNMFVLPGILGGWSNYWFDQVSRKQFLDYNFAATVAFIVTALLLRARVEFTMSGRLYEWQPRKTYIWSFGAMFVIATLWLTVMQAHAAIHTHFIPRQYITVFIFGALLVARSFRAVPGGEERTEGTESAPARAAD